MPFSLKDIKKLISGKSLKSINKEVENAIKTAIKKVPETVGEKAKDAIEHPVETVKKISNAASDIAQKTAETAVEAVKEGKKIIQEVDDATGGALSKAIGPVANVIDESIEHMIDELPVKELRQLAKSVYETAKMILKDHAEFFDKIELTDEMKLFAHIAQYAYKEVGDRPENLGDFIYDQEISTDEYCLYHDDNRKILFHGIRGTVIKGSVDDLISDALIIAGAEQKDERLQRSLKKFDEIQAKYEGYQSWISGHSLGGSQCYFLIFRRPGKVHKAQVFNPGVGLNSLYADWAREMEENYDNNQFSILVCHRILGDIVSSLAVVGHPIRIYNIGAKDPLTLHSIDTFLN